MNYIVVRVVFLGLEGIEQFLSDSEYIFSDSVSSGSIISIEDDLIFSDSININYHFSLLDVVSDFQENLIELINEGGSSETINDNVLILSSFLEYSSDVIVGSVDDVTGSFPKIVFCDVRSFLVESVIFNDGVGWFNALVDVIEDQSWGISEGIIYKTGNFVDEISDSFDLTDSIDLPIVEVISDVYDSIDFLSGEIGSVENVSDSLLFSDNLVFGYDVSLISSFSYLDEVAYGPALGITDFLYSFGNNWVEEVVQTIFGLSEILILSDFIEDSSLLSYVLLSSLSYGDDISCSGKYLSQVIDGFLFSTFSGLEVTSKLSDGISFIDLIGQFDIREVLNVLDFESELTNVVIEFFSDVVVLGDVYEYVLSSILKDGIGFSDGLVGLLEFYQSLVDKVRYDDFVDFVRFIISTAIYLYVNFYMPQQWSIIESSLCYRSDTIFCLCDGQNDGLYEVDFSKYVEDTALILNLYQMASSKVKRIDKIYYNEKPQSVAIYSDKEVYNLDGEDNYLSIPKGVRGKDLKIGIYGMKNVEYVDLGVFIEARDKL